MVNLEKQEETSVNQSSNNSSQPIGMSRWNWALLILLFLCIAGFVYLTTDALSKRRTSQNALKKAEETLQQEQEKNKKLLYGDGTSGGYLALNTEVNRLRKIQGAKAWLNCLSDGQAQVDDTVVTLKLTVDVPPPKSADGTEENPADATDTTDATATADNAANGETSAAKPEDKILRGTKVYLFDKTLPREGGAFLGVFTVSQINGNNVTLTNSLLMTPDEVAKINASVDKKAYWAVYTALPIDSKSLFENSEQLKEILSEETAAVFSNAERELESLEPAFTSLQLKRTQLLKHADMLQIQLKSLEQIGKDAEATTVFYEKEKNTIGEEIESVKEQIAYVEKLLKETQAMIDQFKTQIEVTKARNKQIYAELTKQQITASEKINQKNAAVTMSQ